MNQEVDSTISYLSKESNNLSYILKSQVIPLLMQTRYRKMDIEEKMNQNRNERKL